MSVSVCLYVNGLCPLRARMLYFLFHSISSSASSMATFASIHWIKDFPSLSYHTFNGAGEREKWSGCSLQITGTLENFYFVIYHMDCNCNCICLVISFRGFEDLYIGVRDHCFV